MANSRGKSENNDRFFVFLDSKITADSDCSHEIGPWKESYDKPRQHIKKQRHHFANKGPYSQAVVSLVVMYGCESWTIKKAENWRMHALELLEKTLESPLDCKEIKPINPKGHKPWILIGKTDVEVKAPILWPSDAKSQLIWKDPDAWKDWGQKEKGQTEDEVVGRHHWLNGHAAAAAKSLQLCLTFCDPIDGSLPGSAVPGILQARTLEWVAISFSSAWKWKVRLNLLSGPMDCSPPGSSIHGIFQARVLDWRAIAFSQWMWVWANSGR